MLIGEGLERDGRVLLTQYEQLRKTEINNSVQLVYEPRLEPETSRIQRRIFCFEQK
jgi:hypothetical protein